MFHHGPPTSKEQQLAALTLFQGLPRRELERISALCTMVERPAGTVLCTEGRAGQECFVIVDGEVAVTIGGSEVATLGAGSVFGELAVLDGEPRTATTTATTIVRLVVFSRREFEDLLECAPSVARRILATVGTRLRHADRRLPVVDATVDATADA
jgi:CRP-like cAMP-binding protein